MMMLGTTKARRYDRLAQFHLPSEYHSPRDSKSTEHKEDNDGKDTCPK